MLRFQDDIYLWALLIIPVLILLWLAYRRQRNKRLERLGSSELIHLLMPDNSAIRPSIKFLLTITALALLIIAIARPQMGVKISQEKRKGIEAMIVLDISNSMLAEDVAPSRLEKSKLLVEDLVDHFTDDKVGLVVFAGDAFVQLPITSDYVSAKMFLQNISPSLISLQGTDIAKAVRLAQNSFTGKDKMGRAIILITDGEDHEGGALEAVEAARKQGINVFVLGVGSTTGAPIPIANGGYLKDNTGNTVMSSLNEQMCMQLAQAGKGRYLHVTNTSDAQEQLNKEIRKLQTGNGSTVIYSEYDEQFQAFGILVVLLLIIEVCILEAKTPFSKRIQLFKKKKVWNKY